MNRLEKFVHSPGVADPRAYQPFIDGLRAVSVLLVVLYHFGLSAVPGGFVGVDVFFVISGFLIINQIRWAMQAGTFSYADFWSRRALRILPPYLLVVVACAVAARFVLIMPDDFSGLGDELFHSALMDSNHLYLRRQGYFDPGIETRVLLNLWSLAVEEQFYLAAPILIAALLLLLRRFVRLERREPALMLVTAVLIAASLAACIHLTATGFQRNWGFFLTPLRAWEFMAGGVVSLLLPLAAARSRAFHALLGILGALLIALAAAGLSSRTPYPSVYAALPVAGATLIILAGLAHPLTPVTRLLSWRPLVALGLVSYSWYLWHWPLLVFARASLFGEHRPLLELGALTLSFCLAVATWRLVELPLRRWRHKRGRLGWTPALASVAICLAVGFTGIRHFQAEGARIREETPPQFLPGPPRPVAGCDLVAGSIPECAAFAGGRPLMLVVGDSHAMAVVPSMEKFAASRGRVLATLTAPACPALLDGAVDHPAGGFEAGCARLRDNARRLLETRQIVPQAAILVSNWIDYAGADPRYRVAASDDEAIGDGAFAASLRNTLLSLRELGVKRILVIGQAPAFRRLPTACAFQSARNGLDAARECRVERAWQAAERRAAGAEIAEALAGIPDVRFVDPANALCDALWCYSTEGGAPLLSDKSHLAESGVDRIMAAHAADFEWLAGRR